VFFIEEPRSAFDVSSADKYGRSTVVFPRGDRSKPPIFSTDRFGAVLVSRLRSAGFDPRRDIVCVQGSLCCVGVGVAAIVAAFGPISALLYDRSCERYVRRVLGDYDGREKASDESPGAGTSDDGEAAARGGVP
jgi:hypothetical protein